MCTLSGWCYYLNGSPCSQHVYTPAIQSLPEEKKHPEDLQLLKLAKKNNWRNCPKCNVRPSHHYVLTAYIRYFINVLTRSCFGTLQRLIELASGCRHMVCPCGTEFCFNCGSTWQNGCSRKPACDLWIEEELLNNTPQRPPRVPARARQPGTIPHIMSFNSIFAKQQSNFPQLQHQRELLQFLSVGRCTMRNYY